ncbi:hypothetical protein ACFQ44_01900 [Levilactobacillus lanxiensis]|uniref:Surface layer protein A domain-containing protein n=1 Tax=Levilactobacillus lanxiensis TaxID=2799568 RepID=A0ABW4D0Z6_9LACO|nr:hypothetical protein [Levilactobacillus lanxiensis]
MNKFIKAGVSALVVAVSVGGSAITGEAATWHKGLPTFIQNKKFKSKIKGHTGVWSKATKTTVFMKHTQGDPTPAISHTKYKKMGKVYLIKGKYHDSRMGKGMNTYYYRVQKLTSKKIKMANGKTGKLTTMTRFKHAPKNSQTWW